MHKRGIFCISLKGLKSLHLHSAQCQGRRSSRCLRRPSQTPRWCRTGSLCARRTPGTCRRKREHKTFTSRAAPASVCMKSSSTFTHYRRIPIVPAVVHHVVEDLSAGEVILSARLLVASGGSGGVWMERNSQWTAGVVNLQTTVARGTYKVRLPGMCWDSSQSNASEVHSHPHRTHLRHKEILLVIIQIQNTALLFIETNVIYLRWQRGGVCHSGGAGSAPPPRRGC